MNDNIRKEMKKKREINRRRRNTKDIKEKNKLEKECNQQKEVVKKLVRESIEKYEIKITNEIKEDENRGRKLWQNIHKLIGRKGKEEVEFKVFNREEKELGELEARREVIKYWEEFLGKEDNEIKSIWNEEISKEAKEQGNLKQNRKRNLYFFLRVYSNWNRKIKV